MSNKPTKISQSDLKFYPSERLDDTDEGGGMPLGTPIKGTANEIFNPISSIARVNGDFDSVLLYGGIQRPDNEPLIGSFVAITKPPADPAVSYLLFAGNFGELRKNSIKRIENYASATIESPMTLLSNPSKGSKIIQAYQRVGEKLPSVGDVYCLRQDKQGHSKVEQYVQLVKIEANERTFVGLENREFTRIVLKMEISQVLIHDFMGVDYPVEKYADAPTKIRETHVADAAQYYGIKPLATAVQAGMSTIKVSSIMEKLAPTAQAERAITDAKATNQTPILFDSSITELSFSTSINLSVGTKYLLPFMPGSLTYGGATDQNGKLMLGGEPIGTANPATGELVVNLARSVSTTTVKLKSATAITPFANSFRIDIGIANRSYNHAITLPNVGVGGVVVSYMAQGKWYELKDNGAGALVGTSSEYGSGSINYRTGSIVITCGQLPDVGSAIIFSSGTPASLSKLLDTPKIYYGCVLDQDPVLDSIQAQLGFLNKKSNKKGEFNYSDLKGFYDTNDKRLLFEIRHLSQRPNSGTISYHTGERTTISIVAPSRDIQGQVVLNLSDTAIAAGSLELQYPVSLVQVSDKGGSLEMANKGNLIARLYDDGEGNLKDVSDVVVGTIDYTAATAKFNPTCKVAVVEPGYKTETFSIRRRRFLIGPKYETHSREVYAGFVPKEVDGIFAIDGTVIASFYDNSRGELVNQNVPMNHLVVDLKANPNDGLAIAQGSVVFLLNNTVGFDRGGSIYWGLGIDTGQSSKIGTINYNTGRIVIHNYTQFYTHFVLVSACTWLNFNSIDEVSFRTATAPIRSGSLQLRATTLDGQTLSAIADINGNLDSEWISGQVDAKFGLVTASFGKMVSAQGKENEPWYKAEAVQDGQIWQPKQVIADSVVYNAVSVRHLPINSTVVKIDTVRLPSDGLIPIFRQGDTVLIGNRQVQSIGSAHLAGQTVQLERQNLERICVMDAKDKPVLATLWDYDLDAGTITWKSPLDLSGYTMPLKVMHAIEEKNKVEAVDIDGTLSLMFPIKNSYEPSGTYVSSVLLGDDLAVRHSIPFTQSNWDNVWRDEPNGNQLLNRLNVKDYPIILTDDGAISERWLIKFTSGSQFELYGETLGFVMKTDTLQNLAPINPATGKPYFTIPKEAFGGAQGQAPWQTQNVIRFNTTGTLLPFWVLRAVQPTPTRQQGDDGFTICLFGDTTENEV